jgi:hypothetical protein
MKATSMYIYLEGARFFAHHGVDPQETIVGANFIIDLRLRTDFTHAAQTDELKGTVSYADIYAVVKKEYFYFQILLPMKKFLLSTPALGANQHHLYVNKPLYYDRQKSN